MRSRLLQRSPRGEATTCNFVELVGLGDDVIAVDELVDWKTLRISSRISENVVADWVRASFFGLLANRRGAAARVLVHNESFDGAGDDIAWRSKPRKSLAGIVAATSLSPWLNASRSCASAVLNK
jgi:hypothetical protein